MTHKSGKIAELLRGLGADGGWGSHDPHYFGFFLCFNQARYYEAHDVLEELWLPVRRQPEGDFYKGLIQLAGAFVHLQKGRLHPAARLFILSEKNLGRFAPRREDLDLEPVLEMARAHRAILEDSNYLQNPWSPDRLPRVVLGTS